MHLLSPWAVAVLALGAGMLPAQSLPSDALYAPDRLVRVDIRLAPADWQALRIGHRDVAAGRLAESTYRYYKADVAVDGRKFASVGVRKKGFFGSVISTRPSLKIRFDKFVDDQQLLGLDQLTLNNNVQDPSRIHQFLAYRFFAKAGVHAPRCNFALVTVNGESLGIYSNVESIRKPFLQRVFGSAKGDLYEGYAGDFVANDKEFERIVHKGKRADAGREHLVALREAVAAAEISQEKIGELVDLEDFVRFWAAEVLIAHWDSYSGNRNNYYLFRDRQSKQFHFIPWGADSVFRDPGPFIMEPVPKSVKAVGILCRRLWELPEIRERYQAEVRRQLREVFVEEQVLAEIEAAQKLLEPHVTGDKTRFQSRLAAARAFINGRRAAVEPELQKPDLRWPDLDRSTARPAKPRPMELTGSFRARMPGGAPAEGEVTEGAVAISVAGGEPVQLTGVTVQAQLEDPDFIRPGYPVVQLVGQHPDTQKPWIVKFYIDPIRLELEKPALTVDHFGVWALVIAGDPKQPTAKRRIFGVGGACRIDRCERVAGGAVVGSFRIQTAAFED